MRAFVWDGTMRCAWVLWYSAYRDGCAVETAVEVLDSVTGTNVGSELGARYVKALRRGKEVGWRSDLHFRALGLMEYKRLRGLAEQMGGPVGSRGLPG